MLTSRRAGSLSKTAGGARRSVKKRAGFDINSINPIDYASRAFIPAFFGHAHADTFVKPHHTQRLHAEYSGDKELMLFEDNCDHNSPRPTAFYEAVRSFLSRALHLSNDTSPGQQAMLADVNRLMPDSNAGVSPPPRPPRVPLFRWNDSPPHQPVTHSPMMLAAWRPTP
jgi:hypothetical protein